MFDTPTIADFKARFFRDFPYGTTLDQIVDQDITNALNQTGTGQNFNSDLFDSQASFTLGYLYLSAHYLVLNIRASSQGIAGQWPWMQTAKAAGGVSEAFQIPQKIADNPELAMLATTRYGAQYLEMVLPLLKGAFGWVPGRTHP